VLTFIQFGTVPAQEFEDFDTMLTTFSPGDSP
jgi:hypothetical protein